MSPQSEFVRAVGRVFVGDKLCGTGFHIGNGLVMTCAHVIARAKDPPESPVSVQFDQSDTKVNATLLKQYWRHSEAEDIAVLKLNESPSDIPSLQLRPSGGCEGHRCRTFGYPEGHTNGTHGEATVVGSLRESKVLQISSKEVTVGFSGAPLYDPHSFAVVGMVTAIARKDEYWRLQETGFVTPSETLHRVCPLAIFRAPETEKEVQEAIARLQAGAADSIRASKAASDFIVSREPDLGKCPDDERPECIAKGLLNMELTRVLDVLVLGCSMFADKNDDSRLLAFNSLKQVAAHILPAVFSPAEIRSIRTAIDGESAFVEAPAKTETAIEVMMAGVDGRAARLDLSVVVGHRPRIQEPPESGLSDRQFADDFRQALLQVLRIPSYFHNQAISRINQVLARYGRRGRQLRYYYIYHAVDDAKTDRVRDSRIEQLKAEFPHLVFVKCKRPADDAREFELFHQLQDFFDLPASEGGFPDNENHEGHL